MIGCRVENTTTTSRRRSEWTVKRQQDIKRRPHLSEIRLIFVTYLGKITRKDQHNRGVQLEKRLAYQANDLRKRSCREEFEISFIRPTLANNGQKQATNAVKRKDKFKTK